jgi:hypothetical protein
MSEDKTFDITVTKFTIGSIRIGINTYTFVWLLH